MEKVTRQLGRYHVLDRIAYGGMAEIFRALTFDAQGRGHLVAIKQVLPHYAEDREFIDMLVDEARMVSMLHHENIVEIYEFGHVEEFYFVAMQYIWGKDLRSVLERCRAHGTRIPCEVSAYLLSEALNGLDFAHRLLDPTGKLAGLVHRDFSPSNILISYNGDISICDFGIAKATFSRIETKTGVIKGKVKYMSPEQAFGRKLDHRSDLFSAGSVFYEMLTNEPPFMAKNELDLIFLVRDAQFIAPSDRVENIPEQLEAIVYRGMARARSARFQSAAEFRHSLRGYLRQRGRGNWKVELSRFMYSLYSQEISKEIAVLNEYKLNPNQIAPDFGQNLIADVLGRDAAYSKFNPYPTGSNVARSNAGVHDVATQLLNLPDSESLSLIIPIENQMTMLMFSPQPIPTEGPGASSHQISARPSGPTFAKPPVQALASQEKNGDAAEFEDLFGGNLENSALPAFPYSEFEDDENTTEEQNLEFSVEITATTEQQERQVVEESPSLCLQPTPLPGPQTTTESASPQPDAQLDQQIHSLPTPIPSAAQSSERDQPVCQPSAAPSAAQVGLPSQQDLGDTSSGNELSEAPKLQVNKPSSNISDHNEENSSTGLTKKLGAETKSKK